MTRQRWPNLGLAAFAPVQKRAERQLPAAGAALGDENFKKALEEGSRLCLEEAAAYAQRGRGEHASATHGWASLSPVERQVADHLSHAHTKPGVANRTELARLAARQSPDGRQRR